MEKTINSVMIPADISWKDLGSWESFYQVDRKDSAGNVLKGDVIVHDVKNSYLHAESRLLAAVGINEHLVVETMDAVLVAPLSKSQDIKHIVDKLGQTNRKEGIAHKKSYCFWGSYERLFTSDVLIINLVIVEPGHFFCVNDYFELGGNWIVISGGALVKSHTSDCRLNKEESIRIRNNFKYFIYNSDQKTTPLKLIELRGTLYFN